MVKSVQCHNYYMPQLFFCDVKKYQSFLEVYQLFHDIIIGNYEQMTIGQIAIGYISNTNQFAVCLFSIVVFYDFKVFSSNFIAVAIFF